MGQIAQQAQGQQLQPLNPRGKLKQLVEHSWPQIARVIGGNLDSEEQHSIVKIRSLRAATTH